MTTSGLDVTATGAGGTNRRGGRPAARRDRPPPLGPLRRIVREVGLGLITLGVALLLFVAYQLVGTNFAEEHSQAKLAQAFQRALAQSEAAGPATIPAPAPLPAGPLAGAIDHLVIPKIGVDKYVVQGVSETDLQHGPGHYRQTVLPGELGNSGIAGHRTTYGAPFFRLNELTNGDPIEITNTKDQHFTYVVDKTEVVNPSDVAVLDNTPHVAELTLTTCNPRFSATQRLIVVAKLTGTPLPPPSGTAQLGSGPSALNLGRGNPSAWPLVALFGAIVLVGWILVRLLINRTRRWRRFGAYVGGIAVCLVPLWFLFENVVRLLPQNI